MIRMTCSCGKVLKAPPELAGRAAKCPKCGARVALPAPAADPAPPANPFAFEDGAAPPPSTGLREARRLADYWREQSGGKPGPPAVPRDVLRRLPAKLQKLGEPRAVFPGGAVPGAAGVLGPYFCGPVILMALVAAGFCLGVEELRTKYLWVGVLAMPVAAAAAAGWVFLAGVARANREKLALLYDDGFVLLRAGEWDRYRWEEIASVELRPEAHNYGTVVVFGHQFIVTTKDGGRVVLGMEYFGLADLGLEVMERATAAGAKCSGRANVPG